MATIHLLSVDRMLAQRIAEAMGPHVGVTMVQSLDTVEFGEPGLVVVDHAAIPADRSLSSAIAEFAQAAPGKAVVLASEDLYAAHVLEAIRAGATDVMPRNGVRKEVAEVLTRVINATMTSHGRLGRMTLVLGVDPQATAMAATDLALAHALARTPTLLVDCTLPTSNAEAYLDLKVDYGLASGVADIDRLDPSLLADALARHEGSGLSLITFDGGTGTEPEGLGPSDIASLVQLLRAHFAHVVLCAGSLRHGGLLRELASQARCIEIVCSQSIPELQATRRLLDRVAFDTASAEQARLLVWQHDHRILLDGQRMADALGLRRAMNVPVDRVRAANALNAGRPLMMESEGGVYAPAIRRIGDVAEPARRMPFGLDRLGRAMQRGKAQRSAEPAA